MFFATYLILIGRDDVSVRFGNAESYFLVGGARDKAMVRLGNRGWE